MSSNLQNAPCAVRKVNVMRWAKRTCRQYRATDTHLTRVEAWEVGTTSAAHQLMRQQYARRTPSSVSDVQPFF